MGSSSENNKTHYESDELFQNTDKQVILNIPGSDNRSHKLI